MAAAAGPSFESSAVFTYSFATVSVHTAVPYHIHIHTLWTVFSTKRSAAQCANKRLEYCRLSVAAPHRAGHCIANSSPAV